MILIIIISYILKKRLYNALKNSNCKDLFIGNPNSSTKNDSKERLDYLFLCNTNNIIILHINLLIYRYLITVELILLLCSWIINFINFKHIKFF